MRTSPDSQCSPATLTVSSGLVCSRAAERRVARAVELRSRVVGHAAVDRDPGPPASRFDGTDAVERHTRLPDEARVPARARPPARGALPRRRSRRRRPRRARARPPPVVVVGVVTDAEAATEVGDAGFQPSSSRHAAANAARRAIVSACAAKSGSCEPTWTWRPRTSRPLARASATARGLRRRQAELRAVVARHDRLVRVGVDTERDADEHPPDARGRRERGLARRVEHDGRVLLGGPAEQLVVLVFPCTTSSSPESPARVRTRARPRATSAPTPSSRRSRSTATFGKAFVP